MNDFVSTGCAVWDARSWPRRAIRHLCLPCDACGAWWST